MAKKKSTSKPKGKLVRLPARPNPSKPKPKAKGKHPGGRPTKFTPETIQVLEEAFCCGATREEAAAYAGVSRTALYNYLEKNKEFVDRIEGLRAMPQLLAKRNLLKRLQEGDLGTSWEVLERAKALGYQKVADPNKVPLAAVQFNNVQAAPDQTPEGKEALKVLCELFSGRHLPGPEQPSEG